MTKRRLLLLAAVAGVMCAGCHKTCTCARYDGTDIEYTADEVDDYGVSCTAMRDAVNQHMGTMYLSYCRWTD